MSPPALSTPIHRPSPSALSVHHRVQKLTATSSSIERLIHKLPPELLTLVFTCLCDKNLVVPTRTVIPALTLAGVCTYWRALAMSCRSLWSSLEVSPGDTSRSVTMMKPVIDLVLQKSGESPLDVSITVLSFRDQQSAWLMSLLSQCSRFQYLKLSIGGIERDGPFVMLRGRLPMLQFLAIEMFPPFPFVAEEAKDIFLHAPKLHTFSWTSHAYHDNLKLPFTQLTTMRLSGVTPSLHTALAPCTSLQSLYFDSMLPAVTQDMSSSVITSGVHFLSIHCDGDEGMQRLMFILRLPSLKSLSLTYTGNPDRSKLAFPMPEFLKFLSFSRHTLQTLSLVSMPRTPLPLASLLLLPTLTLTHLSIIETCTSLEECIVDDKFLSTLSKPHRLLPLLTHLSIVSPCPSFKDGTFVQMVQSRWRSASSSATGVLNLHFVRLTIPNREFAPEGMEQIERMRKEGLQINIIDSTVGRYIVT